MSLFPFLLAMMMAPLLNADRRADWMSGGWGIGFRIDDKQDDTMFKDYNTQDLITQLRSMPVKPRWIIVNLSGAAHGGDFYLSYNPTLWSIGSTSATPGEFDRDLFKEVAEAIRDEGIKVIAYMAAQGPALLKGGVANAFDYDSTSGQSPSYDRWMTFVAENYGDTADTNNLFEAYATEIVDYYAKTFQNVTDGWWFDQGSSRHSDRVLITAAVRKHQPDAVIAINNGVKAPLTNNNPGLEDFTFGHPNPIARTSPSDSLNLPMITSTESAAPNDGYVTSGTDEALCHVFFPMSNSWNGRNKIVEFNQWTEDQAVDWMSRVMGSGGAWTWNLPRDGYFPNVYNASILRTDYIDFLNIVVSNVTAQLSGSSPSAMPSSEPSSIPSNAPTLNPSMNPSSQPSFSPSAKHSVSPSTNPSSKPSETPSINLSLSPSQNPSEIPSLSPSSYPSDSPSQMQSDTPSDSSASPSVRPSSSPSTMQSDTPSASSVAPSITPSGAPSKIQSEVPSFSSAIPSNGPSSYPSEKYSEIPSSGSHAPSISLSSSPSETRSNDPTFSSDVPSIHPSVSPTASHSNLPSSFPASVPTSQPAHVPSGRPNPSGDRPWNNLNPTSPPTKRPNPSNGAWQRGRVGLRGPKPTN